MLLASFGAVGPGRPRVASRSARRGARAHRRGKIRWRSECVRGHGSGHVGLDPARARIARLFARQRGSERQLAEARRRVLDAIARLAIRVAVKPSAPAFLLGSRRHDALVERVAVLEAHVALVDRLKARPAGREPENHEESRQDGKAKKPHGLSFGRGPVRCKRAEPRGRDTLGQRRWTAGRVVVTSEPCLQASLPPPAPL